MPTNKKELRNRVIEVFKKYSSVLTVYRIYYLDDKSFLVLAGPGKDPNSDLNSNFYLVNIAAGLTICEPDAPFDKKYDKVFRSLKERVI